jgi:putative membrane protein
MIGAASLSWRDRANAALLTRDGRVAAVLVALGAVLWALCSFRPSLVPFWLPWDFSPLWYAGFAFIGFCYWRGFRTAAPARWRTVVFGIGMALIWTVVQTRYEYLALHQFFYNRLQHMVMHHLGPFLVAVAWPWETIVAGMPPGARWVVEHRWTKKAIAVSRQPEIAGFLFVGLLALWLTPPVHLAAMLSPVLYPVMNWSMVLDGLLFWSLVLDPRPPAEARISFVARAVTAVLVMFPQIAMGAYLCFADKDLYPFYTWCGRLYDTIDPLMDQRIGGAIVWESPGMMSVFTLILVLNAKRRFEEANAPAKRDGSVSSGGWTGR